MSPKDYAAALPAIAIATKVAIETVAENPTADMVENVAARITATGRYLALFAHAIRQEGARDDD